MKPQEFTAVIRDLKSYLLETVKLKEQQHKVDFASGTAQGKCDVINAYQLTGNDILAADALLEPLPEDTQLRFNTEYTIYLDITEFDKDVSFLIGQLLFWMHKTLNAQKLELDYDVYFANDVSCNLAFELKVYERFKGTLADGFKQLDGL